MKILILSFYYPPDIGPGPLRIGSLVDALSLVARDGLGIDVLTTMPNRYNSLAADALIEEKAGGISVRRFALPKHQSGMGDQTIAFQAYARAVLNAMRGQQYDVVIATSSRLMTASLAAWVANRCNARLYLDIRDLFTDTMEDVLGKSPLRLLLPVFKVLEYWTFRAADKINVVSSGFLPYIKRVAPGLSSSVFTNGIDDVFINTDFAPLVKNEFPLVLYAGNIGDGQGLHHIIPSISSALEGKVQFRILGDGGRRRLLQDLLEEKRSSNVQILDPVPRNELFAHYREANVLFLHLNDYKAFHKVLPSKIFEYAATGKPILAGVGGYAADFLREEVPGVEVCEPCDVVAMQAGLQRLLNGPNMINRTAFCSRYLRKNIMKRMAEDVLSLTEGPA